MTIPPTPTPPSTQRAEPVSVARAGSHPAPSSLRMSGKDLINVGIFAALYIAITFAFNMLGFINPLVMLIAGAAGIVAAGIPYMLFVTRVRHAGMVTLFGTISGLFLFLTGHPAVGLAITVLAALAADLVLRIGRYRSTRLTVISYAIFSIWYVGPLLPVFYARDDYFASAGVAQMGPEYVAKMERLLTPGLLIPFDICVIGFALLGALLGARLLRKHFRKAGLA